MKMSTQSLALAALATLPTLAHAHPGHVELLGFASGFAHPLAGADHLLAMLAVGLWGAQLGGRAQWLLPVSFVSFMLLGAGLGIAGVAVPGVEQGIVVSVLLLGLLLVRAARLPLAIGAALVAGFAAMHGLAHGSEMPIAASVPAYTFGFMLSTALLHMAGLALGFGLRAGRMGWGSRMLGGVIALCGLGLAMG